MAAYSPVTGKLYIGAQNPGLSYPGGGFYYQSKSPGSPTIDTAAFSAVCDLPTVDQRQDKGWLAIGPGPVGDPGERVYVIYDNKPLYGYDPENNPLFCAPFRLAGRWHRTSDVESCSEWPQPTFAVNAPTGGPPVCGWPALGAAPVVIRNSATHNGRLVVAAARMNPSFLGQLPQVMYSDDGGLSWPQHDSVASLDRYNDGSSFPDILPISIPDHLPGGFRATSLPSIAMDPNNGDRVFVAFVGRTCEACGAGAANVDIFIALSTDGGATFRPEDTLHLRDADLRLPGETSSASDEFKPAITVDQFGGVDLLYYRSTSPDSTLINQVRISVRLARIKPFGGVLSGPPTVRRLAPNNPADPDMLIWAAPYPDLTQPGLDYQGVAAAGCNIWACYIDTLEAVGGEHVYNARLQRIGLTECAVDVDANGIVDAADAVAYMNVYSVGAPAADFNVDQVVNLSDFTQFNQAWLSACGGRCP